MTSDIVQRAALFAAQAHSNQFRKYKNYLGLTEPYILHPARVAGMVAHAQDRFPTNSLPTLIAAAWCHDVLEDCLVHVDTLVNVTSVECADIVRQLTNPSKDPLLGRAERKRMDRDFLKKASREAKVIKMFDRMDNISSLTNAPVDFTLLYLDESQELARVLRRADPDIYQALKLTIVRAKIFFLDKQKSRSKVEVSG